MGLQGNDNTQLNRQWPIPLSCQDIRRVNYLVHKPFETTVDKEDNIFKFVKHVQPDVQYRAMESV